MRTLAIAIITALLAACSASSDRTDVDAGAEDAGERDAGRGRDAGPDDEDAGPRIVECGDATCDEPEESCESCPLDCDECPTCDMAPTCTGALAVPTSTEPLESCNNVQPDDWRINYACGADLGVAPGETTCADPQLRIRLKELKITRGWFDIKRNVFCVITAEDGLHSELLLTSPREAAGNQNESRFNFPLSQGLLWGQGDLYRSISNVTITYSCFLTSDNSRAQDVIDEISDRAAEVAEHADGYGWVFGTASVLGTIIGSSLGGVMDDQIMDVQQTIDAGALLEMTNGRTFQIRDRRGDEDLVLAGSSDLTLTMETWGCADVRSRID